MWMDGAAVGAVEAAEWVVVVAAEIVVVADWMSWWWHRSGWNSWRGARDSM
jgi:hypothetical protein